MFKRLSIHISGAPGSGKSTLGRYFRSMGWTVYDIDDILRDFVIMYESRGTPRSKFKRILNRKLQRYYDTLISKHDGPFIVVGINYFHRGILYLGDYLAVDSFSLNVRAMKSYRFYIAIDNDVLLTRYIKRELLSIINILDNGGISEIKNAGAININVADITKDNVWLYKLYRSLDYKFYTVDQIIDTIE